VRVQGLTPILNVPDLEASITWFREARLAFALDVE
jgi:hypothetical protein